MKICRDTPTGYRFSENTGFWRRQPLIRRLKWSEPDSRRTGHIAGKVDLLNFYGPIHGVYSQKRQIPIIPNIPNWRWMPDDSFPDRLFAAETGQPSFFELRLLRCRMSPSNSSILPSTHRFQTTRPTKSTEIPDHHGYRFSTQGTVTRSHRADCRDLYGMLGHTIPWAHPSAPLRGGDLNR